MGDITYLSIEKDDWSSRPHINYYHLFDNCLSRILTYMDNHNLKKHNTCLYVDMDLLRKHNINWHGQYECTSIFFQVINMFLNFTTIIPRNITPVKTSSADFSILVKKLDELRPPKKDLCNIVYKIRTGKRYILNDNEIINALKVRFGNRYNIIVIDFDKKSFREQINAMNGCILFMGCHGAGLSNAYFMENGTNMLEIFPESFYASFFSDICKRKHISHYFLHGKSTIKPPCSLETYIKEREKNPIYKHTTFKEKIRDITFTIDCKLVIKKVDDILNKAGINIPQIVKISPLPIQTNSNIKNLKRHVI